jgi:hypothetical protein
MDYIYMKDNSRYREKSKTVQSYISHADPFSPWEESPTRIKTESFSQVDSEKVNRFLSTAIKSFFNNSPKHSELFHNKNQDNVFVEQNRLSCSKSLNLSRRRVSEQKLTTRKVSETLKCKTI